jgi:tetratricopeptide (TPR) repeat protein
MQIRIFRPLWLANLVGCCALLATLGGCRPSSESLAVKTVDGSGGGEITFARQIAPLVYANCSGCHHPGEAAPFSLLSYEDVRSRASQIAEVTQTRFMPPWSPKQGHGEFVGARQLTDGEIKLLADWATAGAPLGDESQLPAAPSFTDDWRLGRPDFEIESPPYSLRADGGDEFRNFVVPVELDSPHWVAAIEVRPENPRVTHHARLGIDATFESARRDAEDDEPGYAGMAWGQDPDGQLVTWAPGMTADRGTPGTAWRLHAQTDLVLHTHMQPSGKPETVRFRIGLHFADEPPEWRPVILRVGSRDVDIPAGEEEHVVEDEYRLPVDVDVHSIFPHAHSLCRKMRVWAALPDGTERSLITIDPFDENWHDNYRYVEPIRLPRGTKLSTRFAYDNADGNVRNRHHPPRRTVYGSNADDEMQDVYLQVISVRADQRAMLLEDYNQYERQSKLVGYRKTLEMYPDDPWSREGLAGCYLGLGQPEKAVEVLEERMQLGPPEVHTIAALGMAYLAAGDFAGAESLQRQALAMDDAYPLAWLGLAKALAAQKKSTEAEQAYRRALELAPAMTDAHLGLADVLLERRALDEAAEVCDAAIHAAPDEPNCYLKLAAVQAAQGRYDESLRSLETAQRLAPYTHPPKVLLAVYAFQNGETERAMKLLAETHAELPDHPVPPLFLGQFARRDGELEGARRHLTAAASLPLPDNWPASHRQRFLILVHSERLQLAQQLEDVELARDALAAWVKVEPDNEKLHDLLERLRADEAP